MINSSLIIKNLSREQTLMKKVYLHLYAMAVACLVLGFVTRSLHSVVPEDGWWIFLSIMTRDYGAPWFFGLVLAMMGVFNWLGTKIKRPVNVDNYHEDIVVDEREEMQPVWLIMTGIVVLAVAIGTAIVLQSEHLATLRVLYGAYALFVLLFGAAAFKAGMNQAGPPWGGKKKN